MKALQRINLIFFFAAAALLLFIIFHANERSLAIHFFYGAF